MNKVEFPLLIRRAGPDRIFITPIRYNMIERHSVELISGRTGLTATLMK
jgi:hypothetical protein